MSDKRWYHGYHCWCCSWFHPPQRSVPVPLASLLTSRRTSQTGPKLITLHTCTYCTCTHWSAELKLSLAAFLSFYVTSYREKHQWEEPPFAPCSSPSYCWPFDPYGLPAVSSYSSPITHSVGESFNMDPFFCWNSTFNDCAALVSICRLMPFNPLMLGVPSALTATTNNMLLHKWHLLLLVLFSSPSCPQKVFTQMATPEILAVLQNIKQHLYWDWGRLSTLKMFSGSDVRFVQWQSGTNHFCDAVISHPRQLRCPEEIGGIWGRGKEVAAVQRLCLCSSRVWWIGAIFSCWCLSVLDWSAALASASME